MAKLYPLQTVNPSIVDAKDIVKLEDDQSLWVNGGLLFLLLFVNLGILLTLGHKSRVRRRNKGASLLQTMITIGDLVCGVSLSVFLFIFNFWLPGKKEDDVLLMCTDKFTVHSVFKLVAVLMGVALARQLHVVSIFGSTVTLKWTALRLIGPFLLVILVLYIPDIFSYIPNDQVRNSRVIQPYVLCLNSRPMPLEYICMGFAMLLFVCCAAIQLVTACVNRKQNKEVFFTSSSTDVIPDKVKLLHMDEEEGKETTGGDGGNITRKNALRVTLIVAFNAVLLVFPLVFAMTFYNMYREEGSRTESYIYPLFKWTLLSVFNVMSMWYYESLLNTDTSTRSHPSSKAQS